MNRIVYSVAMSEELDKMAKDHLLRKDRQEDLCFALWRPSRGRTRKSALIYQLILPKIGERKIHGNASFEPTYFERALALATRNDAGLALMHSHPLGKGWQEMSRDDIVAEQGHAGAVFGATKQPLVGLTLAQDGHWSARFWERNAPRKYENAWCSTVRIAGNRLGMTYMDKLMPLPISMDEQIRTISAWGEGSHADLIRLRVGVIGAGSTGGFIAEALARTGFANVMLIDYDRVKRHNLDRLVYATKRDVGRLKVKVLAERLKDCATARIFRVEPVVAAVYEEEGFRAALDCDLLFSCVDRPWGRHVLNLIAYAHLIPVVDGGIAVRTNKQGKLVAADWRTHTAIPGRCCLQCLGQYDPSHVQLEREGRLEDPEYIKGLPKGHPLKTSENVFAFSMSCASLQMLQMLALTLAPLDRSNPGAQLFHFVGGFMEKPDFGTCHHMCSFPQLVAQGDFCGITVTGSRPNTYKTQQENIKSKISWRKWLPWFR